MTRIYNIRTLAITILLTMVTVVLGQSAHGGQFEVKGQKEIYRSMGKSDLVIKAGKRLEAGKLQQARRLYLKSLKTTMRKNDKFIAYINLSVIHNTAKQYEKALGYSNKALRLAPENGLALNNRGTAYFGLGRFNLAQQDYAKAADQRPHDKGILYNKQLVQSKITPVYAQK